MVAITDGGRVESFSSRGTPLWSYFAGGRLTPHISRSREGTSYICRTNAILIAVNRVGRELWQTQLSSPIIFPVLIGWDSRLFIFTNTEIITMTASGNILWRMVLDKGIAHPPFLDVRGSVVLVMDDGEVLTIDPFGNMASFQYLGGISGAISVTSTSLYIEGWGAGILLFHYNGQIELIYPDLGYGETFRGRLELPSAPVKAAARGEEAAVLMANGRLALLSLWTREIIWMAETSLSISAGEEVDVFYDERGIYVLTRNGAAAFASDGRRLWSIGITGASALPAFGDDGILYSGGTDWILYAYHLEDRVRAVQRLLYGEVSEGSYGMSSPGPSSWAGTPYRFEERELLTRFAEIRQAGINGNIGDREREYTAWLKETAGSYAANLPAGAVPQVQIQHRVEATLLLSYMGSRETIPFLANLFLRDPDMPVKAAAAQSIGMIGVDPEGIAMRAFQSAILPPFPMQNEAVLTSIAAAIGALCRFSGPPLSEAGIRLLTMLSSPERPPTTRRQAQWEIRSL